MTNEHDASLRPCQSCTDPAQCMNNRWCAFAEWLPSETAPIPASKTQARRFAAQSAPDDLIARLRMCKSKLCDEAADRLSAPSATGATPKRAELLRRLRETVAALEASTFSFPGMPRGNAIDNVNHAIAALDAPAPRVEGSEPRGCPTPGACSCPGVPVEAASAIGAMNPEPLTDLLRWLNAFREGDAARAHIPAVHDALNRLYAASPRVEVAAINKDAVEWVVNDIAELGVKIGNQFFWLYKGRSLVYGEYDKEINCGVALHDDGKPMHWRPVGKREFGECCHPVNYDDLRSCGKPHYIGTVSLHDSDEWMPLPAPQAAPNGDSHTQEK